MDVTWTIGREWVEVSVVDTNRQLPRVRVAGDDEPHGRGMAIVEALTCGWGVERLRDGKRVWARVAIA